VQGVKEMKRRADLVLGVVRRPGARGRGEGVGENEVVQMRQGAHSMEKGARRKRDLALQAL